MIYFTNKRKSNFAEKGEEPAMAMMEMFNNLPEEQKKKFEACKTRDELMKVIEEEGIELTDDQLEALSGGTWKDPQPLDS